MNNQKALFYGSISLILLLFVNLTCYAADATWIYKYSVPDNFVRFNDVISVSSGGYLGVGDVKDIETGNTAQNAFISRIDQDGQVLWSRSFTFPGLWYDDLRSVVESSDGGFIATGRILLDGTNEHGTPLVVSAVLILKVDADGKLLWQKLLKNYGNYSSYGARIKATDDGNYVIVGQKVAYKFNKQYSVYIYEAVGALLTKIDTDGQVLFSRSYYGDWTHSFHWSFNDIVQDSDGSYYAIGYASVEGYSEGIGWGGMLIAKIDATGNLVWAKKLDYAQDGQAELVSDYGQRILLFDNALYVTGITGSTFTLGRYSLSGTRSWTKQYLANKTVDTGISSIPDFIYSGDGNFFILTIGACKTITKVNPQGVVLWARDMVDGNWGGQPTSLILEADNGLTVGGWGTGTSNGTIATASKYDSDGNSCKENREITYTVVEIEMVNNSVPDNVASCWDSSDEVPVFSGPILSVEKLCGMPAPSTLMPGIKANGQDGEITVSSGTPVAIAVSLSPGNENGKLADWWLACSTPWGLYSLDSNGWTLGINLFAQYPLFSIDPVNIFYSALPVGDYAFYFVVDMSPNSALDSPFYYDYVQVHVVN